MNSKYVAFTDISERHVDGTTGRFFNMFETVNSKYVVFTDISERHVDGTLI